jgi:putative DNA methylase
VNDDRRLIEDYLPIKAISAEASREKSVRKGHISTLHLWWARRPLVACRAAVYGALVPAGRFRPINGPEEKRASLGRANAAKFITRLCRYPSDSKPEEKADIGQTIKEAQEHILEAHAERLTRETRKPVTVEDILEGRVPRPKVLDMFAGGGSIPLEALRLGCEAYALDLNPVAYIILLCTLVYPQKYGRPDPTARGMTGPPGPDGQPTWGGLAAEVRYWGEWVLKKVKAEIGDLYPLIPDPKHQGQKAMAQAHLWQTGAADQVPPGYLVPVAYLWTRKVKCKNPACEAAVPLVRQTWLCKKKGRFVAMKMIAPAGEKQVRFEVVEASQEHDLGFDPAAFSKGGNATCPFCGAVADSDYIKGEGCAKRMEQQLMAVVCTRPGRQGKVYLSTEEAASLLKSIGETTVPLEEEIRRRTEALCAKSGLSVPNEPIEANPRSMDTQHFGFESWGALFTLRQNLLLLTLAYSISALKGQMRNNQINEDNYIAVSTSCACAHSRVTDQLSSLVTWLPTIEAISHTFPRQSLPMVWDFVETNSISDSGGSWKGAIDWVALAIKQESSFDRYASVLRGTATKLPYPDCFIDAIVTDPPYYDNVSYSNLSDFFYVWLKRTISNIYPEHFTSEGTPKKNEIIAAFYRHGGDKARAKTAYEMMMVDAFREGYRVIKPGGLMSVVYAHKTTLGWSTLIDALRLSGFTVTEAWPIDTERRVRLLAQDTAALASSIFLVARKREGAGIGSYEEEVRPELEVIVRERVGTLWQMGVGGADLLIAAVGAGLKAFTRFARVEYANGEEVPAEKFLAEVEGVVLETLLEKIFGVSRSGVAGVDGPSRFYVLWRYTYKIAEMDAGEAIVFTYTQHVELDGPQGLSSSGHRALVEKKKGKYRLKDFTERGDHEKLGLPGVDGASAPLIDVLHRVLYLMENHPRKLAEFLEEARPDRERLRLLAQVLGGVGLAGGNGEKTEHHVTTTPAEKVALGKLLGNWRHLIEQSLGEKEAKTGQYKLQY